MVWVANTGTDVRSFTREGDPRQMVPARAQEVSLSERTGTLWLTTSDKIMALDRSGTLLLELASENARQWIVSP